MFRFIDSIVYLPLLGGFLSFTKGTSHSRDIEHLKSSKVAQ